LLTQFPLCSVLEKLIPPNGGGILLQGAISGLRFFPSYLFLVWGFFMYYQVCSNYKFFHGKAKLVNLSFHSTTEFQSSYNSSMLAVLNQSRFFHSVTEAQGFISYLYSHHPEYTAPRPELDANQLSFF
jgi:hypothetical protein